LNQSVVIFNQQPLNVDFCICSTVQQIWGHCLLAYLSTMSVQQPSSW